MELDGIDAEFRFKYKRLECFLRYSTIHVQYYVSTLYKYYIILRDYLQVRNMQNVDSNGVEDVLTLIAPAFQLCCFFSLFVCF